MDRPSATSTGKIEQPVDNAALVQQRQYEAVRGAAGEPGQAIVGREQSASSLFHARQLRTISSLLGCGRGSDQLRFVLADDEYAAGLDTMQRTTSDPAVRSSNR
ncbi:hypothetical protein KC340_g6411 [Hortaea werneckii]|nr:hypothetical protein KC342_g6698 [Hortaea werneckii]KAI7098545.1 hypothetical protein KC339_g8878 [Hortaea werneckii]KAI7240692.1 hypothetical protein KC365_g3736 [Hortaea werneckii]KAI7324407.1 hypothetical protein KC340_g6411 [Hortaea werneckii]KAI7399883.1 hypothetical protein KC328_g3835 [Hortaea werneckii]